MARPIVVHRIDRNNVGDMASDPLQYFMPGKYDVIDILNLPAAQYDGSSPIIVGGGGLIGNDFIGNDLERLLSSNDYSQLVQLVNSGWKVSDSNHQDLQREFTDKLHKLVKEYIDKLSRKVTAPRIVWGAGHNQDMSKRVKSIQYPDYLSGFDKVGIRDHRQAYNWVPCASCMHPALEKNYAIKNDIIFFEHKKQLIKSTDFGHRSIPRYVNSGNNIEQTIELLGSANIILTNSYHGAYWGTLLKKKVIVVDVWSTKFYFFKHNPLLVGKDGMEHIDQYIDQAEIFPHALQECKKVTQDYWNEVQQML